MNEDTNKDESYVWWDDSKDEDGDGIFETVAKNSLTLGFIGAQVYAGSYILGWTCRVAGHTVEAIGETILDCL